MKTDFSLLLVLTAILLFPPLALADCSFWGGTSKVVYSQPLQGANLTVGPDVPNGTVIFRQTFMPVRTVSVGCSPWPTTYPINFAYSYTKLPQPLSGWNGTPYPGRVYQTGVPGIGAVLWYAGNAFPYTRQAGTGQPNISFGMYDMRGQYDLSLIKIGPVSPGTIRGDALPSMKIDYVTPVGPSVTWQEVGFSGAINIVSKSCTTPDVNVPLGKQDIAQFTRSGSTSGWVNWNIILQDCPRFYGTIPEGSTSSETGSATTGPVVKNTIQVTFKPNTATIDATQGIIAVETGASSAKNIGIQTAKSDGTLVNLATALSYPLESNSATTLQVGFKSRYISTGNTVTPGKADATMTFLINYF